MEMAPAVTQFKMLAIWLFLPNKAVSSPAACCGLKARLLAGQKNRLLAAGRGEDLLSYEKETGEIAWWVAV